jgi:hypothetical protein
MKSSGTWARAEVEVESPFVGKDVYIIPERTHVRGNILAC